MIKFTDIKDVHLEISSLCNARCPLCPRNFYGYPYNDGFEERNLSLSDAKTIFSEELLNQLSTIRINGNFGDIVMNPEGADIVEYFKSVNPGLKISISTNGSARNSDFWRKLSKSAIINFCLDGLEDTHKLYRQNTDWHTILKNAKTVISSGGIANWKFIIFDHNRHQIDKCKEMSKLLGFNSFLTVNSNRTNGPVFDQHGNLVHILGNYAGDTEFKTLFFKKKTDLVLIEDVVPGKVPSKNIKCQTIKDRSIYISSTGDVYPCCFTGFNPAKFGHGSYHQAVNFQIKELMIKNNALQYPLTTCIEWFSNITDKWENSSYESGRLIVCDDNCGF